MMVLIVVLLKSLWNNACGEYRDVGLCSVLFKGELGLKNLSEAAIGPVECNACGEYEDNGVLRAL